MPLVVMKFVGAKYGNKNVKMIFEKMMLCSDGGKMEKCPLCSDEICWGKNRDYQPTPKASHYSWV